MEVWELRTVVVIESRTTVVVGGSKNCEEVVRESVRAVLVVSEEVKDSCDIVVSYFVDEGDSEVVSTGALDVDCRVSDELLYNI